jgi:hypothetical protein
MHFIPNITPAHPLAPEDQRYRPEPLHYGLIGRVLMDRERRPRTDKPG